MNLDEIQTKCFILALFIRDDDERFLLGARAYEFKDNQLHFIANTYQNDIVEVQGNDGVMLAGQVRRGSAQIFEGYIGDSTVNRSTIEQYRQDFFKFFRKNHYYKVVYIFPDGTAIQRRQGFIVEAPEVKELYQLFPEYHIAMNFEDINYYTYEEDGEGHEIYGKSVNLKVTSSATGGLIWGAGSETILSGEGSNFTLLGTISGNPITDVQLKGDTTQQTYSGKNLINNYDLTFDYSNVRASYTTLTTLPTGIRYKTTYIEGGPSIIFKLLDLNPYKNKVIRMRANFSSKGGISIVLCNSGVTTRNIVTETMTSGAEISYTVPNDLGNTPYLAYRLRIYPATGNDTVDFTDLILTIDNADMTYEPYVGGTPAPSPDYPQEVQTVTGRQVVTITDGGSQSQSYEVNLGKNLFDKSNVTGDYYLGTTGVPTTDSMWSYSDYIPISPNTSYTTSGMAGGLGNLPSRCYYNQTKTLISVAQHGDNTATTFTDTSPAGAFYMRESVRTIDIDTVQIEKGSATSYAPYFEPIELCKIGDYKNELFKNVPNNEYYNPNLEDGAWYVHKEVEKVVFDGSESWESWSAQSQTNTYGVRLTTLSPTIANITSTAYTAVMLADKFICYRQDPLYSTDIEGIATASSNIYIRVNKYRLSAVSVVGFTSWLGSNNVTLYYALATPTDTQITDATLISQLNALAGATTYNDKTIFAVNSDNQLGILSLKTTVISLGGVEWDEYGAEWQEGSGGGPTTIMVDSIDNVYPVWELTGPSVNPQLSDLTTNTTLTYTGTVTSSQTLVIDMFNKTATLNGASVIGNVSGDWVYLRPGVNRITYTTGNAEAPDSTLWWQEIVG